MTNVSKKEMDQNLAREIWQQLNEAVGRLSSTQSTPFLEELLSESEQVMLAKRLAAIILIHEGHSDYAISETLCMSTDTVGRLRFKYNRGEFKSVVVGMQKNKTDYTEFIETLLDVIHLGLPRYSGPRRLGK